MRTFNRSGRQPGTGGDGDRRGAASHAQPMDVVAGSPAAALCPGPRIRLASHGASAAAEGPD